MAGPQSDPVAEHAELIGRVSMAWNSIQYVIFLLFTKLSGLPADKAEAVFFTLKADTAQRDITAKVGAVALESQPALLTQFTDLMKDVGSSQENGTLRLIPCGRSRERPAK
jgi:hypothetical protein